MDARFNIGTIPENETCCFLLTDPRKDLIKTAAGTYVTWISQSVGKRNDVAIHPSKKVFRASKTQRIGI